MLRCSPRCRWNFSSFLGNEANPDWPLKCQKLSVIERCRCGDDVLPKPAGAYGPGLRIVSLEPARGFLILDVVNDKIAAVEVLYRDEIRQRLPDEFP